MENMENNEQVIEEVTEKKETQEFGKFAKLGAVAVKGATEQLVDGNTYVIGFWTSVFFGRKTAMKVMGTLIIAHGLYDAAKYITDGSKTEG